MKKLSLDTPATNFKERLILDTPATSIENQIIDTPAIPSENIVITTPATPEKNIIISTLADISEQPIILDTPDLSPQEVMSDAIIYSESNNGGNSIFDRGQNVFENFNIEDAYVKPKHLSTTSGRGSQFLGKTKAKAETILREAIARGDIISIMDGGISDRGSQKYIIIINAGAVIGTRGETRIKIVLSEDGGMISAYPSQTPLP